MKKEIVQWILQQIVQKKADNNSNHRGLKSIKCGKSNLPFFHSFSHALGNADVF